MSIFSSTCLAGKTFLVTGASSGIGRSVAAELGSVGARVILSGRDEARLDAACSAVPGVGHIKSIFSLNDLDQTAEWVKSLSNQYGSLSGVFHAAGAELIRPVRMTKTEHLAQLFGASVHAAFGIAKAAAQKNVLADGAAVVFMSSVASMRGQFGMTAYSATKAAVDGLVRSLSCELSVRNIRVNSIAAGAVLTEMHDRLTQSLGPDAVLEYKNKHLLGFGYASDISSAAVFLLSDASRWITGSSMVVDGGYTVR